MSAGQEAGGAAGLDALGFTADDLASRGALIERAGASALAVLPAGLAAHLGVPEDLVLADAPRGGGVFCGLGSALLDHLLGDARAAVPAAGIRWLAEPPGRALAAQLAGRVHFRNGVAQVLGTGTAAVTYVRASFAWTAEADDRFDGLFSVLTCAATGAEPDPGARAAIDRAVDLGEQAGVEDGALAAAGGAAALLARRARARLIAGLGGVGAGVARRRERERERLAEYFDTLAAEARRPRRRQAAGAIGARLAALTAEREAKLRDLDLRYTVRVRCRPAALVAVAARVAEVRLQVRRRKLERELTLHLPPGARSPDALACAGCTGTTTAAILCDDALHVLCAACAPEATGRPRCPACRHTVRSS